MSQRTNTPVTAPAQVSGSCAAIDNHFSDFFAKHSRYPHEAEDFGAWLRSRGLTRTTIQRWSAGYMHSLVFDLGKDGYQRIGIDLNAFRLSKLFASRQYVEPHRISADPKDLASDPEQRDPREKLYGLRSLLGDCLAIPKRDLEGVIRSWVGRRIHSQPVKEIAGDYVEGEAPPPGHAENPKCLYLPRVRKDYSQGESTTREEEAFPLLLSPQLISQAKEDLRRPVWLCEGLIDAVLASQAGAASVGLDGAYGHARKWEELVHVLAGPSKAHRKIYLCLDVDPERQDTGKHISMGPGQRGTCELLAEMWRRSSALARTIRVVQLPVKEDGGKVDLGDLMAAAAATIPVPEHVDEDREVRLAYEAQVHAAQAAKLQELQAGAVDPWDYMVRQIPAGLAIRDRSDAMRETGLQSILSHDPDLWAEISERVGAAMGVLKGEIQGWKKIIKSLAREEEAFSREKSCPDEDFLARHTMGDGNVRPTYDAIRTLVERIEAEKAPKDRLWWDEMAMVPMLGGEEMTDVLLGQLRLRLAREFHCDVKHKSDLREVIDNIAGENRKHPVREYLMGLPAWDGTDMIPALMREVLHLSPETEDQRILWTAFLRRWLIGGVARAHATAKQPVQMDTILVLAGEQGAKKTSFFRRLVPEHGWYGSPDISDFADTAAIKLAGLWIAEMAESNGSSYWKDLERQKAFVTKDTDRIVRKYVAYSETVPRTCILGATVNEKQFLADPSGFRRQWCLYVTEEIAISRLVEIRDLLWAQALAEWKAGTQWYLTDEEKVIHLREGQQFQVSDLEQDKISIWLEKNGSPEVSGIEVAEGLGIERPSSGDSRRISRHMQALGWTGKKTKRGLMYSAPVGWVGANGLRVIDGGAAPGASLSMEDLLG